ncbi:MAG: hypothetical protein K6G22_06080 [Lachnospiraceae bacterium]|nr:hypothetical protein [Lachnospiraceae bacterium]
MGEMTFQQIVDLTWIPLLAFAICTVYGLKLIITKDPQSLKAKNENVIFKDGEKFAVKAGQLMLLMAAGALIMCVLLFYNSFAALVEVTAVFILFTVLWKKANDKYGKL